MKTQYLVAILAAFLAAAALYNMEASTSSNNLLPAFHEFKKTYNREYTTEESMYRYSIFAANVEKINKHNADKTQTYEMEVNQFADLTQEEFVEKYLMMDLSDHAYPFPPKMDTSNNIQAPEAVDWRQKDNVLNPIKNQGQCGSCWAFSTTGTLESNLAISKGQLNSFSEQQLVDCCGDEGYQCLGCNGAWPEWAMNYINAKGIVMENEYAYTARKAACKPTPTAKKYLNSAKPWTMIPEGNLDSLRSAIASSGPVSISIDASNWSFYKSGVFSNCGTKVLNHAVVVVGYNSDQTWIVRNSWGANWGDHGYITLGSGNTCGITEHAVVPGLA